MERKPGGRALNLLLSVVLAVGLAPVLPATALAQEQPSGAAAQAASGAEAQADGASDGEDSIALQSDLPLNANTAGGGTTLTLRG